MCEIKLLISTAYHTKIDRVLKKTNQTIEITFCFLLHSKPYRILTMPLQKIYQIKFFTNLIYKMKLSY